MTNNMNPTDREQLLLLSQSHQQMMEQFKISNEENKLEHKELKEMVKIPKGLNSFGSKTKEDLIKEIKIWLQQ